MKFVRVDEIQPAIEALAKRLVHELKAGKKVLWLVPGGSSITVAVSVMQSLPEEMTENLAILLTDERFGLPGHKDSNYKQLFDAGFEHKQAAFTSSLAEGLTLQEAAHRYSELVEHSLAHADTVVGLFGIGADGHIAGILPHSPAATSSELVAGYEAGPYTRLTLTFEALTQLDAAYACVFGESKREALLRLQSEDIALQEQPAQILKHLPEAYVFNDQIGGTS